MRLLFVGSLESTKGVGKTLHILARLREHGVPARLDLAGDGPGRMEFENLAGELHIEQAVNFHGPLTRQQLSDLYAQAHIIILPTDSEGWPKVISEAMAYGVVPVSSNVSCIPQYLRRFATGKTFLPNDIEAFTEAIRWYYSNPVKWKEESNNSVKAAKCFSYPRYLEAVRGLLHMGLIAESSENHACGA
jgi:glycosyltransferase involved in cell wall biosynthesis